MDPRGIASEAGAPVSHGRTVIDAHLVSAVFCSLALEMEKDGVAVNAVCPGYIHTEMLNPSIQSEVSA